MLLEALSSDASVDVCGGGAGVLMLQMVRHRSSTHLDGVRNIPVGMLEQRYK
jgi:hypothetical protein